MKYGASGFNSTEPIFGTLKPFVRGAVIADVKSSIRAATGLPARMSRCETTRLPQDL
jgi:hypothetical protein